MHYEDFNNHIEAQINICRATLLDKAQEYADDLDRLHNFRVAARLQDTTPVQALAGMMAKHTVSIYDMCLTPELYSRGAWEEKITDHINYLLLLKAIVSERPRDRVINPDAIPKVTAHIDVSKEDIDLPAPAVVDTTHAHNYTKPDPTDIWGLKNRKTDV